MALVLKFPPASSVTVGASLDTLQDKIVKEPGEITDLLAAWGAGDPAALERLMPLVFEELQEIARQRFSREGPRHTLQPTAVVHELYLKLRQRRTIRFKNSSQFFAVASEMMRHILVDHARRRRAEGRGCGIRPVSLDYLGELPEAKEAEVLAVHEGVEQLAKIDPHLALLVTLRYFGGFEYTEIVEILGVSESTLKRQWRAARAWLLQYLAPDEDDEA